MAENDDERRLWFRRHIMPLECHLRRYATRLCANIACEPDDLVHDTFVKLMGCASWQDIENVQGFAVSILRNLALQVARRSKIVSIKAIGDLEALNVGSDTPSAERIVEGRDEVDLLMRVIQTLPPQCQRAFIMRKINNLSHAEIADQMNISVSTVEKHIIKGLRICSKALANDTAAVGRPATPETDACHEETSAHLSRRILQYAHLDDPEAFESNTGYRTASVIR